jgi:hypothetical protein
MVDVENTLIFLRPEAGVGENEAVGKVLRVTRHGVAQVGDGGGVCGGAVICHADEQAESLGLGRVWCGAVIERLENQSGFFEIAGFK